MRYFMKQIIFDWPQSAKELVRQAKAGSDLARLIMDGVDEVESWLIAREIVPMLEEKGLWTINFSRDGDTSEARTASCIPLPDGSAFICNSLGTWRPLEAHEAVQEMQYIGARYAPGEHWSTGFKAFLLESDGRSEPIGPLAFAELWTEVTGVKLTGFGAGIRDRIEAIGYDVVDKVFTTQGRLGL